MTGATLAERGAVYLVGAGPGDPGLITAKGLAYLESADVVVYDRLVDDRLVARARPDAELVDAGKLPGERRDRHEYISALLIARAGEGMSVVRLKGGDPYVFGRGGEEAGALVDAGIPFEVVPGVTSAIAAPAYAGIPLTHRGLASSVTIVTGSESPDKVDGDLEWDKLAQIGGTLVVLMGWESLPSIAESLVAAGRPADTPVALIEWGTEPYQRTVVGDLADIVGRVKGEGLSPPIVVVIGEVVGLREKLRWFDRRPLFGKRVLVTRTRTQARALSELLSREGAHPLEAPTLEVQPVGDYQKIDAALGSLREYGWVVFTSANAVEAVFDRLASLRRDARSFHGARVAAIGPSTAAALSSRGVVADLVAEESVSESMVDALRRHVAAGERVLVPGAETRRHTLTRGLEASGATVDEIALYRTVAPERSRVRLAEILDRGIDVATFTSSSAVRNLITLVDGDLRRLKAARVACIGPITAATAREAGMKVDILAQKSTAEGLVDALKLFYEREEASR